MDEEEEEIVNKSYSSIIRGQVPRYDFQNQDGLNLVQNQCPVILTGSDLVEPALKKWTIDYLAEHLGEGPFTVFSNKADDQRTHSEGQTTRSPLKRSHNSFKYYDEKKVPEYDGEFSSDISREEMSFDKFLVKFNSDRTKERFYFQQSLNSAVGRQIAEDFVAFNWAWEMGRQRDWGWGPLTSNLLLVGQRGNVTPCHYDEQQNLFCQLRGLKKFLLFPPDNFPCLYPYPVHHPHDRQSQVDFDYPDYQRFPKFKEVSGVEAVLSPGDILYIPMYWWHHVINLTDTIGINFWHKSGGTPKIEYPLQAHQKVAMIRNIEKMLLEALQDQADLSNLFHWIVDGRF